MSRSGCLSAVTADHAPLRAGRYTIGAALGSGAACYRVRLPFGPMPRCGARERVRYLVANCILNVRQWIETGKRAR